MMGVAPGPAQPPIVVPTDVATVLRDARTIVRAHGDGARFAAVENQLRSSIGQRTSIVVVGEVGRGKSTLVNALMGVRNLSPTGHGETTGAFLSFVPPDDSRAQGTAVLEFVGRSERVDPATLHDWVTIGSAALEGVDVDDIPIGATVAVASRHLPDAVIVDTPGAGGLNARHANLALSRAGKAGILVLVTDAGAPLTRPALSFLSACAENVEAVVVVMNKIDLYPRWPERVAENRVALARTHPRFANLPIIGVSAAHAVEAIDATDPRHRELAHRAGNIDELLTTLRALLEVADDLPYVNGIRMALTLLRPVASTIVSDRLAVTGGDAFADELAAKERQLARLRDQRSYYRFDWNALISTVQNAFEREVDDRLDAFERTWQAKVDANRLGLTKTAQNECRVEIIAEVALIEVALRRMLADRLQERVAELYADVGPTPSIELLAVESRAITTEPVSRRLAVEAGMLLPGASGAALTTPLAVTTGIAFLPVIGAAAVIGVIAWSRHLQSRKQVVLELVRMVRSQVRSRLLHAYREAGSQVTSMVMKDYDRQLARLIETTRAQEASARRNARATAEQRDGEIRRLDTVLEEIDRVQQRAARVLQVRGNFAARFSVEPVTDERP